MGHQFLVFFVAFIRMREFEQFDFLELVLPQDAAGVFPGRPGFRPKTGRPCGDIDGQPVFGQRFIPVQVVQLNFTRRCQPEIAVFDFE